MNIKKIMLLTVSCLSIICMTSCANDGIKDGNCCEYFGFNSAQANEYQLEKSFVSGLCLDSKEMEGLTPNINVFDYAKPSACDQLPEKEQPLMLPCTCYMCSDKAMSQLMVFDEAMKTALSCCQPTRPDFYSPDVFLEENLTQEQKDAIEKYHQCFKDYFSTRTCANTNESK